MIHLPVLPALQVVCILAAIANRSSCVGAFAFRPIGTSTRATRHDSCLSSSIPANNIGSTGIDASTSTPASSVKVVNYNFNGNDNDNDNQAALIHGPAHTAALEHARTEQTQTPSASTTEPSSTQQQQVSNAPSMQSMTPPNAASTRTAAARPKSPVVTAESVDDILSIMDGTISQEAPPASGLTLVLFHAHYCKICQRATMQLGKASKEYPTVQFAKIEAKTIPEPSADNLRQLGVSKFPFLQIFRHGDCVASFSTGPSHMFMRKVRGTLDLCLDRDEDCWKEFCDEFASEIRVNRDARNQLGRELLP